MARISARHADDLGSIPGGGEWKDHSKTRMGVILTIVQGLY